jgi:hypothetical protein
LRNQNNLGIKLIKNSLNIKSIILSEYFFFMFVVEIKHKKWGREGGYFVVAGWWKLKLIYIFMCAHGERVD